MDGEALANVIRGAQRGDAASLDRLVRLYAGRVYGFLYRMTGDRDAAEDLMQEAFMRLVRTIGDYEHDGRFEAWLFRIAANLARDRVRRLARGPRWVDGQGGADATEAAGARIDGLVAVDEAADAAMMQGEAVDALNAALRRLPDAEREVIMLRHFSQMSFKEIARLMGTPMGTALARAHRGLARLRQLMGAEDAGAPAGAIAEGTNR